VKNSKGAQCARISSRNLDSLFSSQTHHCRMINPQIQPSGAERYRALINILLTQSAAALAHEAAMGTYSEFAHTKGFKKNPQKFTRLGRGLSRGLRVVLKVLTRGHGCQMPQLCWYSSPALPRLCDGALS